jgi:hypothetical protein
LCQQLTADPEPGTPPLSAVLTWLAPIMAAWTRVMRPLFGDDAGSAWQIELVWRDGAIDPVRSRVGASLPATGHHDDVEQEACRRWSSGAVARGRRILNDRAASDRDLMALTAQLARRESEDSALLRRLLSEWSTSSR